MPLVELIFCECCGRLKKKQAFIERRICLSCWRRAKKMANVQIVEPVAEQVVIGSFRFNVEKEGVGGLLG